jgi:uncharacterized membrane protein
MRPASAHGRDGIDVTSNRHEAPEPPDTLQDRFRDAIARIPSAVWVISGAALTLAASATMKRARQYGGRL